MSEALDRVEELREAMHGGTDEDQIWLGELERDIKRREQYQSFLAHPVTKEIVEKIIAWVTATNDVMLSGKGTPLMKEKRDNLLDILTIFSPARANTDSIVKSLEPKIKEFRDYYGQK